MIGRAADPAMNGGRTFPVLTIAACSVALLAPLLAPLLTGRVFVYNDLSWFHLPMRLSLPAGAAGGRHRAVDAVDLRGLYLHGEGQVGLFHPFHQLLYRFFPLGTAFNLELIANYPAGLRRHVLVPAPAPVQPRGVALRRHAVRVQRLQPAAPPSRQHGGRRRAHALAAGRRRRADRRRAQARRERSRSRRWR